MNRGFLNIIQFINTAQPPFRGSVLDYSHLEYSDIIDSMASSILILSLTAILLHFPSATCGFSTRCLFVRTLFEKSLLPDFLFAIRMRFRSARLDQSYRSLVLPYVIAGCLQLILLLFESLIIFSSTQTYQNISFEELKFRAFEFAPYDGEPFSVQIPSECPSFFDSVDSVVVPANSLCLFPKSRGLTSNRTSTLEFVAQIDNPQGKAAISVSTNHQKIINPFVWFQTVGDGDELVILNSTSSIRDPSLYSYWASRHISKMFNCSLLVQDSDSNSNILGRTRIDDCSLGDDESRMKAALDIIYSSLRLSNSFLSRDSFNAAVFSVENGNFTYTPGANASSVDWDVFIQYQTSRVSGYVLWIVGLILFLLNLLVGSLAPDIQLTKAIAVTQRFSLPSLPLHLRRHVTIDFHQQKF